MDKKEKQEGNLTYNEALYLINVLPRIPVTEVDNETKAFIHITKKELAHIVNEFESNRDFIYLMNDGIEETNQQGGKYFTEPKFELRKEFKGSDSEYKDHVIKIQKIKRTIYQELVTLGESLCKYTLKPSLSEEQFEKLLKILPSTDFDSLKNRLCK